MDNKKIDNKKVRKFYSQRLKNAHLFTYDQDGDLVQKDKDGGIVETIKLSSYRSPTLEEHSEAHTDRKQRIAHAEDIFEQEFKKLRNLANSGAPDDEVLRQNRVVEKADTDLQSTRFPLKMGYFTDSVDINQVLFENQFEKRKMPYRLSSMLTYPFNLQTLYVRDTPIPVAVAEATSINITAGIPSISNQASTSSINKGGVILFSRPATNDYGYMSMHWPVNFEYNTSMYVNAQQAILAEMAKIYEDEPGRLMIMSEESPDEILYTKEDVKSQKDISDESWNQNMSSLIVPIIRAKFKQHPELSKKLISTGKSELGAVEPGDTLLGIGLAIENTDAQLPQKWSGQNMIGKALEYVRDELIKEAVTRSADNTTFPTTAPTVPTPVKKLRLRRPLKAAKPVVANGI